MGPGLRLVDGPLVHSSTQEAHEATRVNITFADPQGVSNTAISINS